MASNGLFILDQGRSRSFQSDIKLGCVCCVYVCRQLMVLVVADVEVVVDVEDVDDG
jgi:hypothetical protein